MSITITMSERKDCIKDIPAALIAVNSQLSPKFPNVISDERSMASGKAWGISINPM